MAKKPKKIINDFDATDFIAIIVIIGGFILMALKIDTVVGGVVTMTAGFYFGRKSNGGR
jgi:hypothetical protein